MAMPLFFFDQALEFHLFERNKKPLQPYVKIRGRRGLKIRQIKLLVQLLVYFNNA